MNPGMVIVGAGECGARAALFLRMEGYAGRITLIGAEPHLPYERPPVSKAMLSGDASPAVIADETRLASADISFRRAAEVVAIERAARELVCADGQRLSYDKLLLATGARSRRLSGVGTEGVLYLRDQADCHRLSARLVPGVRLAVIGAGFLGLEIAASARARGADVTIVESQPRPLMRGVPAEVAALVAARHAAAGVALHCGTAIASITASDSKGRVTLADGRAFDADILVAAVGAVPNTELADAAGLAVDNGIRADATLLTSDPNIYAAGDCCSVPLGILDGRRVRLESWRSAGEQAAVVARNMLGAGEPHEAVPWFWSDQYDLTLQVAGLYEAGLNSVQRDLGADAFISFHLATDGRLLAASGIGPAGRVARDIKLAEMLIARRATPDLALLAQPDVKLKSMLAA